MTRAPHAVASIVLTLALSVAGAPSAGAASRPYFAHDGSKDSIYQEWAIHPQAVRDADQTIVVYQGPGLDAYARAYDHTTGDWSGPYRVGDNPLATDMHGAPALVVDRAGYLHVFYGGHHSPLRHARSLRPHDISAWQDLPAIAQSFTYPQPVVHDDGTIDLFYRDGSLDWVVRRSTNDGATWSSPTRILDKDGRWGFYANFSEGVDGEVLAAFVALDWDLYFTGTSWARRDAHYMRRDTNGVWRNTSDTPVTLPLTKATADSTTRVYASGSANTNNPTVKPAPDGDPCLMFTVGSGAGPTSYAHRFMRLDGGAWTASQVARTDHFFDVCTFRFDESGDLRALTIEGGTRGVGDGDRDYTDDGGLLVERNSANGGVSWPAEGTIVSPDVPEAIYQNPQVVRGGTDDAAFVLNEWTSGSSIFGLKLYLSGDGGPLGAEFSPHVKRVSGGDRIATSVAVSKEAFPVGAKTVVVASAADYADALAGGPLAYALDGPVLLSSAGGLSSATAAELKRLAPTRVVLVGGQRALAGSVATGVRAALPKTAIERISGANRYDTANRIARRLAGVAGQPDAAIVVTGRSFADGSAVAGWAAYRNRPILLTERTWLPPETASALASLAVTRTIVIGDDTAVGAPVFRRLPAPTRISGADRYSTAAAVAEASLADGMLGDRFVVAGGRTFPDSLTAGVLSARLRAPLLLTAPSTLSTAATDVVNGQAGTSVRCYVVGGQVAVSTDVGAQVLAAMNSGR